VPAALEPWQPVQLAPAIWPWKSLSPAITISRVAPSAIGRLPAFAGPSVWDVAPGASSAAALLRLAESFNDIGLAAAFRILERNREPSGVWRVIAEIFAGPSVHIDNGRRTYHQMAGIADAFRKHRRADAGGQ
jgi:hypothetical protein